MNTVKCRCKIDFEHEGTSFSVMTNEDCFDCPGWTIGNSVSGLRSTAPRYTQTVARIVSQCLERYDSPELWDGYQQEVKTLLDAAEHLINSWEEFGSKHA
jgi:hypothetical protein